MERELAREEKDAEKVGKAVADADQKSGEARIKTARDLVQQKANLHQITVDTEYSQLADLAARELALEQTKFDALARLYKNDAAEQAKIGGERVQAEQKYAQEIIQLQTKADQQRDQIEKADLRRREQMFAPITRAFDTSIKGMVLGTQTFQQAIGRLGQSIAGEFINTVIKRMVDSWVAGETTKTVATTIGATAREAADSQGSNKSLVANIKNTGKSIETDAVGVYGNVFNYLSPELGPFAAIPAALAAASIVALSLPSAAGGMIVPNDTLAMVHENEMVLPARYTSGLTSMIDQANGNGASGTVHNHYYNVTANGRLNAKDLDGLHDAVVGSVSKAARNGQFGGMRT